MNNATPDPYTAVRKLVDQEVTSLLGLDRDLLEARRREHDRRADLAHQSGDLLAELLHIRMSVVAIECEMADIRATSIAETGKDPAAIDRDNGEAV